MIGIIGLGWLGLPLARKFKGAGFKVKGTTTTQEKQKLIEADVENVHLLKFESGKCIGELSSFLKEVTTLIVTLPPQSNTDQYRYYLDHLTLLKKEVCVHSISKLIFTSSTGVFEDTFPYSTYTEETVLNQFDQKSSILQHAERLFMDTSSSTVNLILRLGGLVGAGREPAKYLSGKFLKNPFAPVNLVHQNDAIELIFKLTQEVDVSGVYHAVYPLNLTREVYYSKKATSLSIPPPIIETSSPHNVKGKIVCSQLTQERLGFKFKKRP